MFDPSDLPKPSTPKAYPRAGDGGGLRVKSDPVHRAPPDRRTRVLLDDSADYAIMEASAAMAHAVNPYGDGFAAARIVEVLQRTVISLR